MIKINRKKKQPIVDCGHLTATSLSLSSCASCVTQVEQKQQQQLEVARPNADCVAGNAACAAVR